MKKSNKHLTRYIVDFNHIEIVYGDTIITNDHRAGTVIGYDKIDNLLHVKPYKGSTFKICPRHVNVGRSFHHPNFMQIWYGNTTEDWYPTFPGNKVRIIIAHNHTRGYHLIVEGSDDHRLGKWYKNYTDAFRVASCIKDSPDTTHKLCKIFGLINE